MAEAAADPRQERVPGGRHHERRGHPRTSIPYVRCWSPTPGAIIDAGRKGLGIETFRRFQRGDSVFLTIRLTGRTGRIHGHIRWCRRHATAGSGRSPVFHIGVELASPIEESWLTALMRPSRAAQAETPSIADPVGPLPPS